jgi:hypothetical protein
MSSAMERSCGVPPFWTAKSTSWLPRFSSIALTRYGAYKFAFALGTLKIGSTGNFNENFVFNNANVIINGGLMQTNCYTLFIRSIITINSGIVTIAAPTDLSGTLLLTGGTLLLQSDGIVINSAITNVGTGVLNHKSGNTYFNSSILIGTFIWDGDFQWPSELFDILFGYHVWIRGIQYTIHFQWKFHTE